MKSLAFAQRQAQSKKVQIADRASVLVTAEGEETERGAIDLSRWNRNGRMMACGWGIVGCFDVVYLQGALGAAMKILPLARRASIHDGIRL